jgi:hypothetical protein
MLVGLVWLLVLRTTSPEAVEAVAVVHE